MASLQSTIYYLDSLGITDVLLPFILIFSVVFSILQKTKIFGEKTKNINVVVSVIMGLLVVIPHVTRSYPPGADVVEIINSALPNIGLVLIAIISLFLVIGLWGVSPKWGSSLTGGFVIGAVLIVGYIFGTAAGWFQGWSYINYWLDPDTQALLVVILVFGLIISFISKDDDDKGKSFGESAENIGKKFSELFSGSK